MDMALFNQRVTPWKYAFEVKLDDQNGTEREREREKLAESLKSNYTAVVGGDGNSILIEGCVLKRDGRNNAPSRRISIWIKLNTCSFIKCFRQYN